VADWVTRELGGIDGPPQPPPAELLAAVRAEGPQLGARRRARVQRRSAAVALVIATLMAASLTPPGRAATGWLAGLAGIGEEPTLPQVGSVRGSASVIENGTLSDGTPFEVVVTKVTGRSWAGASKASRENPKHLEKMAHGIPDAVCFHVDWPGIESEGHGGDCVEGSTSRRRQHVETIGPYQPPDAGPTAPGIFMAIVSAPQTKAIRVMRDDDDGTVTELPSRLITLEGSQLRRLGGGSPVSVFVSPLSEANISASHEGQAIIAATALDGQGHEIGRTQLVTHACLPRGAPGGPRRSDGVHPLTKQEKSESEARLTACFHGG
jgi:hypothetical protein